MTETPVIGGVKPTDELCRCWSPASNWSLEEGVCLAFAVDPNTAIRKKVYGPDEWDLPPDALQFLGYFPDVYTEGYPRAPLNPTAFVRWAREAGLAFHQAWDTSLEEVGSPESEEREDGVLKTLHWLNRTDEEWAREPRRRPISDEEMRVGLIEKWARYPSWTHAEGLALSINRRPDHVDIFGAEMSGIPAEVVEMRDEYLKRTQVCNEIEENPIPADFIRWAEQCGFSFHDDWYQAVPGLEPRTPEHSAIPIEKSLSTRERESLLKLVIGMAIGGYGFDPNKPRNNTTKDIYDDLQTRGVGLDRDTILKWLREGANLVPPEAWDD